MAQVSPLCPVWELGWPLGIAASSTRSLARHRPCLAGHGQGVGCPNMVGLRR